MIKKVKWFAAVTMVFFALAACASAADDGNRRRAATTAVPGFSYEDSVQMVGHSSPKDASDLVAYNPRGMVIPTQIHVEWWQKPRVTWISINPHYYNGANPVASIDAPSTSTSTCYSVCNGTMTVCSTVGTSGPPTLTNYATWAEREAAWNALSQLQRNYTAKLAIPIGETVYYSLVTPGSMHAAMPSVICP